MKKKHLLLGLGLFGVISMSAQTSPYTGSPVGEGTFYFYNVETGTWIQTITGDNRRSDDNWTTGAGMGTVGLDLGLAAGANEGEYKICPKMGPNDMGPEYGDGGVLYLDGSLGISEDNATRWSFEPVEGVSNGYNIFFGDSYVLGVEEVDGKYILTNDGYSNNQTWQLVTLEERVGKLAAASESNKLDATFLIPWYDLGRNDSRDGSWVQTFEGDGVSAIGGVRYNSAREVWKGDRFEHSTTLSGLPNGTYEFTVQGYYRDGNADNIGYVVANGEETIRAEYFAGAQSNPFVSIYTGGSDVYDEANGYYFNGPDNVFTKYYPNDLDAATRTFVAGGYQNEPIVVAVTDGTLQIGARKNTGVVDDWTVFDNFRLTYLGTGIDLSQVLAGLNAAIEQAEAITTTKAPFFITALAKAKEALSSTDATEINNATLLLLEAIAQQKEVGNNVDYYNETLEIINEENVSDTRINEAKEKFENSSTARDINDALKLLRDARKDKHAERHANVFAGNAPAAGEFYLYNVGQQRFFTGGSDWGAHAALGVPGTLLTLEASEVETDFHINTGLRNGGDDDNPNQYLTYRGYCDGPKAGAWRFIKLSNGNYNIVQADYPDVFVKFNPMAGTDAGNGDYTTVGTEERNVTEEDLDAQWILVTRSDRDALLENATASSPADATYYIVNPGFNQRAEVEPAWAIFNGSVWGRGDNHPDFALESFDSNDCSFSQSVQGLKPGFYLLSCQGFYRDGNHSEQARLITEEGAEPAQLAYLYSGMADVLLPNITAEAGKAPGLGNITSAGEYPDGIDQACQYFQNGLYRVELLVEVDASGILDIGVAKDQKGHDGDWVVVDNFRLTYYGTEDPTTGIQQTTTNKIGSSKIYNLMGVEVKDMNHRGIYIKDGKKIIVK